MTPKTRYILLGVLATLSSIALIAVLTLNWGTKTFPPSNSAWRSVWAMLPKINWSNKDFRSSDIPVYPNSNNAIRSIRGKIPWNVFIRSGVFFDDITTFQTSGTAEDVLAYYQTTYSQKYKCNIHDVKKTTASASFTCVKSSQHTTTTYSVKITINSTSSSVNTISVSEVQYIQANEDW